MKTSFPILALAAMLSATMAMPGEAQVKPKPPKKAPAKTVVAPTAAAPAPERPQPPATDVRLKTAQMQGAQISYTTTYIQGPRQRVEFPGVVALDQCDLKQSVMLNTGAKRYRVQPYAAADGGSAAPQATASHHGGVVTITTTLSDTLERQTMLGLEARHIKTVVAKQAAANACDKSPMKIEIDAWYVDLPAQAHCERPAAAPPAADPNACTDQIETRVAGDVKLGFPLMITTTTTTGEGDELEMTKSSQEVTELEITRLDRSLFEVPAGYVEASSGAEIVPALAAGGSLSDALFGSTADGSSTAAPKKAGMIRIGILEPVNKTSRNLPPSGLRHELVEEFKAPYEAIPVAGTSPEAIAQDAARLECDYLLLTEITEVKTSKPGRFGGVMKMASGGGPSKDKHEVKLAYKLFAVDATGTPKVSGNAKASSGGFGVGSAFRLAAFAGQMYVGMTMMGGRGMGMMNPMAAMSGTGGLGPMGASFFDPRASAMSSMAMGLGASMPGMGDPSEAGMRETVSDALGNEAKSAMEQLGKKK